MFYLIPLFLHAAAKTVTIRLFGANVPSFHTAHMVSSSCFYLGFSVCATMSAYELISGRFSRVFGTSEIVPHLLRTYIVHTCVSILHDLLCKKKDRTELIHHITTITVSCLCLYVHCMHLHASVLFMTEISGIPFGIVHLYRQDNFMGAYIRKRMPHCAYMLSAACVYVTFFFFRVCLLCGLLVLMTWDATYAFNDGWCIHTLCSYAVTFFMALLLWCMNLTWFLKIHKIMRKTLTATHNNI